MGIGKSERVLTIVLGILGIAVMGLGIIELVYGLSLTRGFSHIPVKSML
jgi:hypothetical protein